MLSCLIAVLSGPKGTQGTEGLFRAAEVIGEVRNQDGVPHLLPPQFVREGKERSSYHLLTGSKTRGYFKMCD